MLAVGIKKGAPKSDISTPEALKAAMLNAKSVANRIRQAAACQAIHFAQIAERWDLRSS
jgi:hypothetical protein